MSSRLRKDLRWSSREGSTCCVMLGAGESSLAPYVLAAGHSSVAAGLVTTLPLFLGGLLQNVAPWALARVGSVRTWSVAMASLQGLCLLILAAGATIGSLPLLALFGLVSLYWAAGWSVGPAWNTWMDSVIPARLRAVFFARRNAFCMLVQWATMMAASGALYLGQQNGVVLGVFASLFALAGVARLYSAWSMSQQSEPVPLPANYRVLSLREVYAQVKGNPKARPLLYMLGAQFSLALAAPYFVPFLKEMRGIGYGEVLLCVAAAIFSRALVLPRLGPLARRIGPKRLFAISGVGLAAIPLLWLIPGLGLGGFLLLQAITGGFLATYEMAVTLVYLEAIPVADRTSVLTRFSIFNTLAMLLGSSVGATILMTFPQQGLAYGSVFLLAAVARVAALKLLAWGETSTVSSETHASVVEPVDSRNSELPHHVVSSQFTSESKSHTTKESAALL